MRSRDQTPLNRDCATAIARKPAVAYSYHVSFVHLHCHSEYSLLDGANRIDDLITKALEFEQPALAITDHGNLHGAWEFQEKAKKAGSSRSSAWKRTSRRATDAPATASARPGRSPTTTSCCSPANADRLQESSQALVARLHRRLLRQAAHRSRAARKVQRRASIVSSACMAGEVAHHLLADEYEQAREAAAWYAERLQGPVLPRGAGARLRGPGQAQRRSLRSSPRS